MVSHYNLFLPRSEYTAGAFFSSFFHELREIREPFFQTISTQILFALRWKPQMSHTDTQSAIFSARKKKDNNNPDSTVRRV